MGVNKSLLNKNTGNAASVVLSTVIPEFKTPDEAIAYWKNRAQTAETMATEAMAKAFGKAPVTADIPEFGQGGIAFRNVTGFMPFTLYAGQFPRAIEVVRLGLGILKDPIQRNRIRCVSYAAEASCIAMGIETPPASSGKSKPKSDDRLKYESLWTSYYKAAMADVHLVPKNTKYIDPEKVLKSIPLPITIG